LLDAIRCRHGEKRGMGGETTYGEVELFDGGLIRRLSARDMPRIRMLV
jgi:hypothetical protein